MMKNKKGISPLIATVLIIGFTIVLAALVITWGTKLVKTTVDQTQTTSELTAACTTGLKLDVERVNNPVPGNGAPGAFSLRMRNGNQAERMTGFQFVVYDAATSERIVLGDVNTNTAVYSAWQNNQWMSTPEAVALVFPAPKVYGIRGQLVQAPTRVEVYPAFTIGEETKYCEEPIVVPLGA